MYMRRERPRFLCGVPNCFGNSSMSDERHYFRFPRERERWLEWLEACGRLDLKSKGLEYCNRNVRLCHLHFEEKWCKWNKERARLRPEAVPTIFSKSSYDKHNAEVASAIASICGEDDTSMPIDNIQNVETEGTDEDIEQEETNSDEIPSTITSVPEKNNASTFRKKYNNTENVEIEATDEDIEEGRTKLYLVKYGNVMALASVHNVSEEDNVNIDKIRDVENEEIDEDIEQERTNSSAISITITSVRGNVSENDDAYVPSNISETSKILSEDNLQKTDLHDLKITKLETLPEIIRRIRMKKKQKQTRNALEEEFKQYEYLRKLGRKLLPTNFGKLLSAQIDAQMRSK